MKILLSVGEGLGNCIQVLPLAKALAHNGHDLHILNLSHAPNKDVEWLFSMYAKLHNPGEGFDFDGLIELATTKGNLRDSDRWAIPLLNDLTKQFVYATDINEVDTYLSIIKELNMVMPENPYDVRVGKLPKETLKYDFCVHNGCSLVNPKQWDRKKINNMELLIERLEKLGKVTSIGARHEYCGGIENISMPLKKTAEVIQNSNIFISNDTGTYHLAAAMKKQGIVLFTATSVYKNKHPLFHKSMRLITAEVDCQPCQYTQDWQNCSNISYNKFACKDINIDKIMEVIKNEF